MKVILLKDIQKFGKKFEIKNVSDGYAKNYLIPNNLAVIADKKNLAIIEKEKEMLEKKAEKELKRIQEMIAQIDGLELVMKVKINKKNGKIYGSVNNQKIYEELVKKGFAIKKEQITLNEPIKAIGEYPVKIAFDHNLEAEIKVIVEEEQ